MSKSSSQKSATAKGPTYRIPPDGPWANAWKVAAVIGAVGTAMSAFGMYSDPERFPFSWLYAFMSFLALALGGLIFTIIQHAMGSGWGVTVRRMAEFLLTGLPLFAVLFIPILLNLDKLYPWIGHTQEGHEIHEEPGEHHDAEPAEGEGEEHGALGFGSPVYAQDLPRPQDLHPGAYEQLAAEEAGTEEDAAEGHEEGEGEEHGAGHDTPEHHAHAEILLSKGWYLTESFFLIRAFIYFLIWIALSYFFFSTSTKQDRVGKGNRKAGIQQSQRMEGMAPLAIMGFALSLTFAAFDWSMGLEPTWYSTIFGVQYFAVSAVIAHAVIILLSLGLARAGHLGKAVTVEHQHDVGKLLFGFIVFWAYVSFSQFMLIWYAGIPEEATYYHLRYWGGGGFQNLSILLFVAGFFIPFFTLISRNAKRREPILAFACAWVVVMHFVQTYWLIMPYAEQVEGSLTATELHVHWLDFAALFSVGGIYSAFVLWIMTRYPLIPVGDPRLEQALHHEVV